MLYTSSPAYILNHCIFYSTRLHLWLPIILYPTSPSSQQMDPHAPFLGAEDAMSHGPMMSHGISHNYFSAPGSNSNTGYNTPHHPVAQSGYNTPHGLGYSHPSTGTCIQNHTHFSCYGWEERLVNQPKCLSPSFIFEVFGKQASSCACM